MKTSFFMLFYLAIATFSFCQDTIKEHFAISATQNNFLYKQVDNPIEIAVSNISSNTLFVKVDNGIINGSNGKYVVRVDKGTQLIIFLYSIKGKDTTYIGQNSFRLKNIPSPTVYIADKTGKTNIKKVVLLNTKGLTAHFNNFDIDIKILVKSFELKTIINKQEIILKSSDGRFTDEMTKVIAKSEAGAILTFQNIKLTLPNREINVDDMIILTLE